VTELSPEAVVVKVELPLFRLVVDEGEAVKLFPEVVVEGEGHCE